MPQNDIEGTVLFHTEDGPMAGEAVVRLTYNPENDEMVLTPKAVDNILTAIDDTLYKEVERAKSLCDRFVITVEHDTTENVLKGCGRCLLPRGRHGSPSSLGGRQGQEGGLSQLHSGGPNARPGIALRYRYHCLCADAAQATGGGAASDPELKEYASLSC
jgi:hypothetical protein